MLVFFAIYQMRGIAIAIIIIDNSNFLLIIILRILQFTTFFKKVLTPKRVNKNNPYKRCIMSIAPELKLSQTFEIILPNLIHKSKKRNLK